MISLEKGLTFTKMPKNVGDMGKIIVAKGFKRLPKDQLITQSGHTACKWDKERERVFECDNTWPHKKVQKEEDWSIK